MFEVGDKIRLKQDLMFRLTPLTRAPVLHKHFEAGRVGKIIQVHKPGKGNKGRHLKSVFPGSVIAEFYTPYSRRSRGSPIDESTEADYSVSFMGKEQIEKFLEKVE